MAREKAKQLLPIIQAYAEGKTIEWFSAIDGAKWEELTQPLFDARMQYRIKPDYCEKLENDLESQGLKNKDFVYDYNNQHTKHYRSFNNCGELIEYWYDFTGVINCSPKLFMPQIWVKHKRYGTKSLITAFDNNNESIGANVIINDIGVTMKMLFDNYTFCDGSVCGVIE